MTGRPDGPGPEGGWDWITPGVAVGGELSLSAITALPGAGVRGVIDLRDEAADDPASFAREGLGFLHLPTPDHAAPGEVDLRAGVAFAAGLGGPVLIHCREGVGRSATLALCVLVDGGLAPMEALVRAKDARWQVSPSPAQYEGWAGWLRGRGIAPPDFDAFAAVAYRHLR